MANIIRAPLLHIKNFMKLRILFFEDDHNIRNLLAMTIGHAGHEVLAYPDPTEWRLCESNKCCCSEGSTCADAVITDNQMPRMTGLEFVGRKKAAGCKAVRKTLLFSGDLSPSVKKQARQLGCTVFAKPMGPWEILDWIKDVEEGVDPDRKLLDL
jgi:CheY-like chemotaxis protein